MSFLVLDDLTKRFDGHAAVDGVSLGIEAGEIMALLGPSGSGKTTTLRLLAGFEAPDRGRVLVEGEDVVGLAPVRRRFGMVFQHYALFPHLDVGENVAFGLESLGVRGADLERRVRDSLALVDLAGFERRAIGALSGGQQQRVALARALAPEPRVLLLDEPLSNLDPALRERTRREIRDVIRRVGITTVLVTHEQEEAFDLGDRIALLREGRLEQAGTPDELYARPASVFVAGFIGRASALPARVTGSDADMTRISVLGAEWRVPSGPRRFEPGASVTVMVRPESLAVVDPGAGLPVTVVERRFNGATAFFLARSDDGSALEVNAAPDAARVGDRVGLAPRGAGIHLYPPAAGGA